MAFHGNPFIRECNRPEPTAPIFVSTALHWLGPTYPSLRIQRQPSEAGRVSQGTRFAGRYHLDFPPAWGLFLAFALDLREGAQWHAAACAANDGLASRPLTTRNRRWYDGK